MTTENENKNDITSNKDHFFKIHNTDTFDLYNKLKKGETSDAELSGFIRYLQIVVQTLNPGEDEQWDIKVLDNIQKAALIFNAYPEMQFCMDGELDFSTPFSLYKMYFSILIKYANITYRTDNTGKHTFTIGSILGDIDFNILMATAMPASKPEKIDPAEINKHTRKGITAAALAFICALPQTRAFFATDLGHALSEPLIFAAGVESAIRGKKKGFLIFVAYLIGLSIFFGNMPMSKVLTISLTAFYTLRAAISLPKAVKLKKKLKANDYHKYEISTRIDFYHELDSMISVLNVIKNEISPKIMDDLNSEASAAYFNYCISEFRNIRNQL